MVRKAKSAVPAKDKGSDAAAPRKEGPLEVELGSLLYYDQKKASKEPIVPFEQIPDVERQKFITHAAKVLLMLDQLNKMVVPLQDPVKDRQERLVSVDDIEILIREFLKKVTKPPKVAQFFPVRELAVRIVEGRLK